MTLTAIQLDSIIDRKSYQPKRDDLLKAINLTLREFDIQTPLRIAMYLAQVIHDHSSLSLASDRQGEEARMHQ
jgi:predicted chitinase